MIHTPTLQEGEYYIATIYDHLVELEGYKNGTVNCLVSPVDLNETEVGETDNPVTNLFTVITISILPVTILIPIVLLS